MSPEIARRLLRKLKGGPRRKTRLHDEKGNRVDLVGMFYAGSLVRERSFGFPPELPRISYRAIGFFDKVIRPDWRVVEFGSGTSTLGRPKKKKRRRNEFRRRRLVRPFRRSDDA